METTIIDKDNLQYFKTLLLPEALQKLQTDAPVFALGAVDDGMACGALTGGPQGSSFFIDSLFVSPSCRGRGAGTALLNELARIASEQEKLRELRCAYTIDSADHTTLGPFLRGRGFTFEPVDDPVVAVPLEVLERLTFYKNTQSVCRVYTLAELPDNLLRILDKRLALEGGQLLETPLDQAPLDRECSTVTLKNEEIDACLLLEKIRRDRFSLAYADAGSTIGSGTVFSSMLITSYRAALKKYPTDTQILIQPVTALSQALVARLAPEAHALSYAAVKPLY